MHALSFPGAPKAINAKLIHGDITPIQCVRPFRIVRVCGSIYRADPINVTNRHGEHHTAVIVLDLEANAISGRLKSLTNRETGVDIVAATAIDLPAFAVNFTGKRIACALAEAVAVVLPLLGEDWQGGA